MHYPACTQGGLATFLQSADVAITLTTNRDENYGFSQIEASLAGLPVIATSWGGSRDIVVDGVTGFLIDVFTAGWGLHIDEPTLKDPIRLLAADSDLRRYGCKRSNPGHKHARFFDWRRDIGGPLSTGIEYHSGRQSRCATVGIWSASRPTGPSLATGHKEHCCCCDR
ncbi:glycosyltransferase [Kribbella sp. DT2]|uniref:glycosyltransferase n=1 Tax=Kribbella sp. DT2 TaxID=3393427 RepID=UPI003CE9826A